MAPYLKNSAKVTDADPDGESDPCEVREGEHKVNVDENGKDG